MDFSKVCVRESMTFLPIFVHLNDTIENALLKMERFEISKIVVCDEDYNVKGSVSKGDIKEYLLQKRSKSKISTAFLKKITVKDVLRENTKLVMAYPKCSLQEMFDIMNAIKTKYLPVVKSPWNQKLEGFITLEESLMKAI